MKSTTTNLIRQIRAQIKDRLKSGDPPMFKSDDEVIEYAVQNLYSDLKNKRLL